MTTARLTATRRRVCEILQVNRPQDSSSRTFDIFLITVISLNVMAIVLESNVSLERRYGSLFHCFELLSVAIFSVEYVARVWSSIDCSDSAGGAPFAARIRYMLTPMALIDLIAILPFYLSYIFPLDLRILRIIRLLRVFKLTRYHGAMQSLLSVLQQEAGALFAAFFVMFMLMLLAASGIYLIEHNIQPAAFGSIPEAMWWALATLTTVGYGDVVPITALGKVFGGVIIFVGVGLVALPTGIIASGFANNFRRQRVRYEALVDAALDDGELTPAEIEQLSQLREHLDIAPEDAELIFKIAVERARAHGKSCPHCGMPKSVRG